MPRSRGGTNDLDNLQFLCFTCNCAKGSKTNEEAGKTVTHQSAVEQAGYTMIPNAVLRCGALSMGARVVYGLLKSYAWQSEEAWPGKERVAEELGVSLPSLRDYIKELVDLGLITEKRRGRGMTNVYVIGAIRARDLGDGEPIQTESRPSVQTEGELSGNKTQGEEDPEVLPPVAPLKLEQPGTIAVMAVVETWSSHAPPLIDHRASYLREEATRRAITRAHRVYETSDICAAIANYATVLAGDEFRWSYRWTIIDFLKRGLDRFVPEARPLENFRANGGPPTKFGRRDVSSRELLELAERMEDADATG